MAVSLTLLPTNDNSDNSSSSNKNERADSGSPASLPPPTPLSPHHPYHQHGNLSRPGTADSSGHNNTNANHNNANASGASANEKRKTSRRANTAERRATHNAVERQRRETLNGRFLDLANLLPNLTSVRRPSKSAIVNSSIAIIHSQRRSRALAARELVNLYNQFCALKAECDEWRARAGIPPVEEGERSSEWNALMEYAGTIKDCELEMGEEERGALRAAALASGGLGGGGGGGMNGAIGLADDDEEDLVMPPGGGMMGLGLEDELPLPTPTSETGSNPLLDGIELHHHQHHAHHAAHHPHHIQHPAQHPNQVHHPMHQVAAAAAPMHKQNPSTTTTPTAAQLAHQQHLAQVYAQAQGNLQLAQQQMQWAQQQASANVGIPPPPSAVGGRGRSSTFSHLPAPQVQIHPLHTSAPHDIVSPFDNGSDLFHDSISILGGVPPSGMINAHHQPFHHGQHHHHGHITPPIKSEWPGFPTTTGTRGATGGTGGMPTTYDESISSISSGGSDAAQSPSAASSISGAASPVALTSASHVGRSRASSLNHGAVSAPVPVPIGGGGQGNMVMNMFY